MRRCGATVGTACPPTDQAILPNESFGRRRAGRKSCPLAHPLAPLLVESDDLEAAFAHHARLVDAKDGRPFIGGASSVLAVDARLTASATSLPARLHRRNDDPGDRLRWHFGRRAERVYSIPPVSENKGEKSS